MPTKTTTSLVYNEAKKAWKEIAKTRSKVNLKMDIELYRKMLSIFQVGDFFIVIFNTAKTSFEYCGGGVTRVLGLDPHEFTHEYFLSLLHPEDVSFYVSFETQVAEFFRSLQPEKVMKYKIRYDFRVKRKDGQYVRIMQQVAAAIVADDGAIMQTLTVFTDISHLKTSNNMSLSIIGLYGEPSYIDAHKQLNEIIRPQPLSKREKQVLALLVQNKTSDQIADLLHISKHTVNNHRKKMLRKTDTATTLQLVMKAVEEGWM